nr:WbqC family protein [Wenzhouxiangella sp. XN201]
MQPYFLPYLGYWQIMNYVDTFVVYDDIQFTKKGWIHRNRYLNNGKDRFFTLPLKKDSDYLDVRDREISTNWPRDKQKLYNKIKGAYATAPFFNEGMTVFNRCIQCESQNLFTFLLHSIHVIKSVLDITSNIVTSSNIGSTKHLKGQSRVIEICRKVGADEYLNPIGGKELYNREAFEADGIALIFHEVGEVSYKQLNSAYVRNLSIIDTIMFNGINGTKALLPAFRLL